MFELSILFPSILNGLTTGAVYALIALGLTLIYGVLHIINFAHGASLMLALYAVFLLKQHFGIDPYLALPIVVPGMFVLGYALQRLFMRGLNAGISHNPLESITNDDTDLCVRAFQNLLDQLAAERP